MWSILGDFGEVRLGELDAGETFLYGTFQRPTHRKMECGPACRSETIHCRTRISVTESIAYIVTDEEREIVSIGSGICKDAKSPRGGSSRKRSSRLGKMK